LEPFFRPPRLSVLNRPVGASGPNLPAGERSKRTVFHPPP
jgi:hypothetical protein